MKNCPYIYIKVRISGDVYYIDITCNMLQVFVALFLISLIKTIGKAALLLIIIFYICFIEFTTYKTLRLSLQISRDLKGSIHYTKISRISIFKRINIKYTVHNLCAENQKRSEQTVLENFYA